MDAAPDDDATNTEARTEEIIAAFQRSDFLQSILQSIETHVALENHSLVQENDRLKSQLAANALEEKPSLGTGVVSAMSTDSDRDGDGISSILPVEQVLEGPVGSRTTVSHHSRDQATVPIPNLPHSLLWRKSNTNLTPVAAQTGNRGSRPKAWHGGTGDHTSRDSESSGAIISFRSGLQADDPPHRGSTQDAVAVRKRWLQEWSGVANSKSFRPSIAPKEGMFADIDDIKKAVRSAIVKRPYDVAEYYKDEGFCQAVAKSSLFDMITLLVIGVNSIWVAVDVDVNGSQSVFECHVVFIAAELSFTSFFSFEWMVRFGAFAKKGNCVKDAWFIFDTFLLLLMYMDLIVTPFTGLKDQGSDTSVLKLMRVTRLTRMARMAKLMSTLPELTILLKAIGIASRSVFFTLILLTIVLYVFAVAFRTLTDGTHVGRVYFRSVPFGMKALLMNGILPDLVGTVDTIGNESFILGVIFLVFILMGSLTVMNMLVGVLVEVVSVVSHIEKEQMKVTHVKTQLFDMLNTSGLKADEDMVITRSQFEWLLMNPGAAKVIHEVGVDPIALVEFTDHIFGHVGKAEKGLSFEQFIDWILSLRGSNSSTVKDIVDLRQFVVHKMIHMENVLLASEAKLLCEIRGRGRLSDRSFDRSFEATTTTILDINSKATVSGMLAPATSATVEAWGLPLARQAEDSGHIPGDAVKQTRPRPDPPTSAAPALVEKCEVNTFP